METELTLLRRARALDQEALAEIHDTYYNKIYRYISFRVNDLDTVEDLTSEVFTRFLRALRDKHAPQNTIRGWLFGAASNVVKEHYRKQSRAKHVSLNESLTNGSASLDVYVDQALSKEQLHRAMKDLTEEQQQVLALRFGYGMPIREVAETLNKSVGSVKMLQARAIAALSGKMSGGR